MFSIRTVERLMLLLKGLGAFFGVVALLAIIFPNDTSFTEAYFGWVKSLVIGIPIWLVVEFAGTKFQGFPYFDHLSSQARIAAITAIIVVVILAITLGVNLVKNGYSL